MRDVYQVPDSFLADLESVCPVNANMRLSNSFLADLQAVFVSMSRLPGTKKADLSSLDLLFLERNFDRWREVTRQKMLAGMALLPKDDPMYCSISLFGTMDHSRLERAHTKTLAWLLNPEKKHGFGARLLVALLSHLANNSKLPAMEMVEVESEYPVSLPGTAEGGRLDVMARGRWAGEGLREPDWLLVIEAKIDSEEQEEQLARYDEWLDDHYANHFIWRVFLTPDSRKAQTARKKWPQMTFLDLVCIFRTVLTDLKGAEGYHFLRYYLSGVLQDICHWSIPVKADCQDPYAVIAYLDAIRKPLMQEYPNGSAW
jgi:hypothetical protein